MILTMSDTALNRQLSIDLSKQYSLGELVLYPQKFVDKGSKLYIVDVSSNQNIYLNKTAKAFAAELIQMGLPDSVKDIYMIMSDLKSDQSLISFCNELAKAFTLYQHRKIAVHAPAQLGYDMTVVMPAKNGKWQIYGLYDDGIIASKLLQEKNQLDFDYIHTINDKVLLWEGEDIQSYLNDPQKIYDGITYVWAY